MINEEEKKAIEIVKKIKNIKFNVTSSFYSSGTISLSIEEKEAIETALNLITKLQKENEEKEKQIDLMAEEISAICTGISSVREQLEKNYCEFINSDKDCCWKTDKSCKDCIFEYFEKLAK